MLGPVLWSGGSPEPREGWRSKQREESGVSVRVRSHGEKAPLRAVPRETTRCNYITIYLFYLLKPSPNKYILFTSMLEI